MHSRHTWDRFRLAETRGAVAPCREWANAITWKFALERGFPGAAPRQRDAEADARIDIVGIGTVAGCSARVVLAHAVRAETV